MVLVVRFLIIQSIVFFLSQGTNQARWQVLSGLNSTTDFLFLGFPEAQKVWSLENGQWKLAQRSPDPSLSSFFPLTQLHSNRAYWIQVEGDGFVLNSVSQATSPPTSIDSGWKLVNLPRSQIFTPINSSSVFEWHCYHTTKNKWSQEVDFFLDITQTSLVPCWVWTSQQLHSTPIPSPGGLNNIINPALHNSSEPVVLTSENSIPHVLRWDSESGWLKLTNSISFSESSILLKDGVLTQNLNSFHFSPYNSQTGNATSYTLQNSQLQIADYREDYLLFSNLPAAQVEIELFHALSSIGFTTSISLPFSASKSLLTTDTVYLLEDNGLSFASLVFSTATSTLNTPSIYQSNLDSTPSLQAVLIDGILTQIDTSSNRVFEWDELSKSYHQYQIASNLVSQMAGASFLRQERGTLLFKDSTMLEIRKDSQSYGMLSTPEILSIEVEAGTSTVLIELLAKDSLFKDLHIQSIWQFAQESDSSSLTTLDWSTGLHDSGLLFQSVWNYSQVSSVSTQEIQLSFSVSNGERLTASSVNFFSRIPQAPQIQHFSVAGNAGLVTISLSFQDYERQSAVLEFAYSTGSQFKTIQSTHFQNLQTSYLPDQSIEVQWISSLDISTNTSTVLLKTILSESSSSNLSTSSIIGPMTLLNQINRSPVITTLVSSGTSGLISLLSRIYDRDADPLNLQLFYSTDGAQSFLPTTNTSPASLSLTASTETSFTFLWNSAADLPVDTGNIALRLVASDPDSASTSFLTTIFSLLNQPNRTPAASQFQIGGSSQSIPVSIFLSDPDSDFLNLKFEYSVNSGQSFSITTYLSPSLSSITPNTFTSFLWNSSLDISTNETQVLLRATPSDPYSTGSSLLSTQFSVFNQPNRSPVASLLQVTGTSGDLSINLSLTDLDQDLLSLGFEYSTDSGTSFQPTSHITPSLSSLNPSTNLSFVWLSSEDIQIDLTTVLLRATPSDPLTTGIATSSAIFSVLNLPNQTPYVSLLSILGSSGIIPFQVVLQDADQELLSLGVEFSTDSGASFNPTSQVTPGLTSLPVSSLLTFYWDSSQSISVNLSGVMLRVTPSDPITTGIATNSNIFSVFNQPNNTPTVALTLTSGSLHDILLQVNLGDPDQDNLNLELQYNASPTFVWTTSDQTYPSLTGLSPQTGFQFLWKSKSQVTTHSTNVLLRVRAHDGRDWSNFSTSAAFALSNGNLSWPLLENPGQLNRVIQPFEILFMQAVDYQDPGNSQRLHFSRPLSTAQRDSISPIVWSTSTLNTVLAESSTFNPGRFALFQDLEFMDVLKLRELSSEYYQFSRTRPARFQSKFRDFILDAANKGKLAYNYSANPTINFDASCVATPCATVTITGLFSLWTNKNYSIYFLPSLKVANPLGLPDFHGDSLSSGLQGYYVSAPVQTKLVFPFGRGSMRQLYNPTSIHIDFNSTGMARIPTSAIRSRIKSIPTVDLTTFASYTLPSTATLLGNLADSIYTQDAKQLTTPGLEIQQFLFADKDATIDEVIYFLRDSSTGTLFLHSKMTTADAKLKPLYKTILSPVSPTYPIIESLLISSSDYSAGQTFTTTRLHLGDSISFTGYESYTFTINATPYTKYQEVNVRLSYRHFFEELSVSYADTTTTFTNIIAAEKFETIRPVSWTGSGWAVDTETATPGSYHRSFNLFGENSGVLYSEDETWSNTGTVENPSLRKYHKREIITGLDIVGGARWNENLLPR